MDIRKLDQTLQEETDLVALYVRIPRFQHRWLTEMAERHGLPMTVLVRLVIAETRDGWEKAS